MNISEIIPKFSANG